MKDDVILFGCFRLAVAEGLLEQSGNPVKLSGRALDTLIALVEDVGKIVDERDTYLGNVRSALEWAFFERGDDAEATGLGAAGGALAKGIKVAEELVDLQNKLERVEAALHEAERRCLDAQMQLAHVNRIATMGQLAASIVHEINQPIGAGLVNAETALRWLAASPPKVESARQSIDRVIADGKRAADIVGRIHDLAKKAPAKRESMEINDVVLEVIGLIGSEMLKNGISMQTRLTDCLPSIWGDRVQLQQVILNLIMNAIEAMSEVAEGSRELLITTGNAETGGVLVAVSDSGAGLPQAGLDRIFQAFYTTKPGGLGIGLSICRSIIEAHGGRLWAVPNEPRGAVFRFALRADNDSDSLEVSSQSRPTVNRDHNASDARACCESCSGI
jgi:signal transduction histidine kinase